MTNNELLSIYEGLNKLNFVDIVLPASINFARRVNINKIKPIAEEFNNARIELIKKFGTTLDNGDVQVLDDNIDEYRKEFLELLNISVDIELQKIPADVLNNIEVTPEVFDVLYTLIDM